MTTTTQVSEVTVGQVLRGTTATYSVLRFLGEGCFGKVLECLSLETNEKVAVKMLKDPAAIREAEKEVAVLEFLRQLDNERCHVVTFKERFHHMGVTCLVFEMLEISLWDYVQRNKPAWTPSEIRPFAQQLLEAFYTLNSINVIHTDLKPDNIMLTDMMLKPYRVKVIDFGLARHTSEIQQGQMRQPTGYRAPEVALGCMYDGCIDMFSLGCTLCFLLLEEHLFPLSVYQSMKMIVELLGMPPDEMLNNGRYTSSYFKLENADLRPTWRLLTPDEYREVTGLDPGKATAHYGLRTIDDLSNIFTIEEEEERTDFRMFVDFLKGLLAVDPRLRLSPMQALQHPFITMAHLTQNSEYSVWCNDVMQRANLIVSGLPHGALPADDAQRCGSNWVSVPAANAPPEEPVATAMEPSPQDNIFDVGNCSNSSSMSPLFQVLSQPEEVYRIHINQHFEEGSVNSDNGDVSSDHSPGSPQPDGVDLVRPDDNPHRSQKDDEKSMDGSAITEGQILQGNTAAYSVLRFLGEGCFGQVLECLNLETHEKVAVKMLKDPAAIREADKEVAMLEFIGELDTERCNVVTFKERFSHRGVTCLVFEKLDTSLWDFVLENDRTLGPGELRPIAQQLLVAFQALDFLGVAHTDLKPDNIMLADIKQERYKIKLIDFGLARRTYEIRHGQMRQPRGYRAPEVTLGCKYGTSIDMFGLGCTLGFLLLGDHLFTASSYQSVKMMVTLMGMPPADMLRDGRYSKNYFKQEGDDPLRPTWRLMTPDEYSGVAGQSPGEPSELQDCVKTFEDIATLFRRNNDNEEVVDDFRVFLDFLKGLLTVDPRERLTPEQALQHPFITMAHLTQDTEYSVCCRQVMQFTSMNDSEGSADDDDDEDDYSEDSRRNLPRKKYFETDDDEDDEEEDYDDDDDEEEDDDSGIDMRWQHSQKHFKMDEDDDDDDDDDDEEEEEVDEDYNDNDDDDDDDDNPHRSQKDDEKSMDGSAITEGQILQGNTAAYSVLRFLGEGCFGQVLECLNLETHEKVAVKMLKDPAAIREADKEVAMLEFIGELDTERCNVVTFKERFSHRGVTCLVFEKLDTSLWDFVLENDRTLGPGELRPIAQQLLVAFQALDFLGVAHTDLKPDNIMLADIKQERYKIKLIDFGLARRTYEIRQGQMRQPRGYRAPEVTLGCKYGTSIDMFGLGCTLGFLLLGDHLFTASSYQSVKMMVTLMGMPPADMLRDGRYSKNYFKQEGDDPLRPTWRLMTPDEYSGVAGQSPGEPSELQDCVKTFEDIATLFRRNNDNEEVVDDFRVFLDFLKGLLTVDPKQRLTPEQALQHPFITMAHLTQDTEYSACCREVMQFTSMNDSEGSADDDDEDDDSEDSHRNLPRKKYFETENDEEEDDDDDSGIDMRWQHSQKHFKMDDDEEEEDDEDNEDDGGDSLSQPPQKYSKEESPNIPSPCRCEEDVIVSEVDLGEQAADDVPESEETVAEDMGPLPQDSGTGAAMESSLIQAFSQPEEEVFPVHINQHFEEGSVSSDSGDVSSDHSPGSPQPDGVDMVRPDDNPHRSQKDDEKTTHMEGSAITEGQIVQGNTEACSMPRFLCKGCFGQVLECLNLQTDEKVAVKMLKDPAAIREADKELLVALKALNYLDVVHTDLRPDNIMLTDLNQEPCKVKLITFALLDDSEVHPGRHPPASSDDGWFTAPSSPASSEGTVSPVGLVTQDNLVFKSKSSPCSEEGPLSQWSPNVDQHRPRGPSNTDNDSPDKEDDVGSGPQRKTVHEKPPLEEMKKQQTHGPLPNSPMSSEGETPRDFSVVSSGDDEAQFGLSQWVMKTLESVLFYFFMYLFIWLGQCMIMNIYGTHAYKNATLNCSFGLISIRSPTETYSMSQGHSYIGLEGVVVHHNQPEDNITQNISLPSLEKIIVCSDTDTKAEDRLQHIGLASTQLPKQAFSPQSQHQHWSRRDSFNDTLGSPFEAHKSRALVVRPLIVLINMLYRLLPPSNLIPLCLAFSLLL